MEDLFVLEEFRKIEKSYKKGPLGNPRDLFF
jgi:hypothetical protein